MSSSVTASTTKDGLSSGTLASQLGERVPEGNLHGKIVIKNLGNKMMNLVKNRFAGFIFIICVSLFLSSCKNSPTTYTLTGRVSSKQPATQQLVIDNDNIPGFMPTMTMPYDVKVSEEFGKVQPSDIIQADVIVAPGNKFWLERIIVTGKGAPRVSGDAGASHVLMIGEKVPDVPMINQDGKTIHFGQFKGEAVLLTFIYTRCPFPDFCPLLSSRFATIQSELANNAEEYKSTHLISISLDPDYDKPAVLREYGLKYISHDPTGFQHWDFVSTTTADLQKLVAVFGLEYSEQNSLISHSLNTVLLAADGTVVEMWPGKEWQTSEILDVMSHTSTLSK
jgi:protein SCO1/2